jgi:predicted nucleic acid-binding protein
LVQRGIEGVEPFIAAEQNLLEWYSVITSTRQRIEPLTPNDATRALRKYHSSRLVLVRPTYETSTIFEQLLVKRSYVVGKDVFDLYLAATALSNGIGTILSDNVKDFAGIPGLTAVNPFA